MSEDILRYFSEKAWALPIYEAAEKAVLSVAPGAVIKVSKTQISFADLYQFAYVW